MALPAPELADEPLGHADAPPPATTAKSLSVTVKEVEKPSNEITPSGQELGRADGISLAHEDVPDDPALISKNVRRPGLWQRSLSIVWPLASWLK